MKIRLAGDLTTESIVDGEGVRTVVWTQGCLHHCPVNAIRFKNKDKGQYRGLLWSKKIF